MARSWAPAERMPTRLSWDLKLLKPQPGSRELFESVGIFCFEKCIVKSQRREAREWDSREFKVLVEPANDPIRKWCRIGTGVGIWVPQPSASSRNSTRHSFFCRDSLMCTAECLPTRLRWTTAYDFTYSLARNVCPSIAPFLKP